MGWSNKSRRTSAGTRRQQQAMHDKQVGPRILELRKKGCGWRLVAGSLNKEGFLTPHGSNKWDPSQVRRIAQRLEMTSVPSRFNRQRRIACYAIATLLAVGSLMTWHEVANANFKNNFVEPFWSRYIFIVSVADGPKDIQDPNEGFPDLKKKIAARQRDNASRLQELEKKIEQVQSQIRQLDELEKRIDNFEEKLATDPGADNQSVLRVNEYDDSEKERSKPLAGDVHNGPFALLIRLVTAARQAITQWATNCCFSAHVVQTEGVL